jgi:hypothetical protein
MQEQMYLEKRRHQILFLKTNDIALVLWAKRSKNTERNNSRGVKNVSLKRDMNNNHKVFDKMHEPKIK